MSKVAGWVANRVDTDETPRSAASHPGLPCLLRPIWPNTYGGYCSVFFYHNHFIKSYAVQNCNALSPCKVFNYINQASQRNKNNQSSALKQSRGFINQCKRNSQVGPGFVQPQTATVRHIHNYSEPSLQRHLFPNTLPLKWIRCRTEYLWVDWYVRTVLFCSFFI